MKRTIIALIALITFVAGSFHCAAEQSKSHVEIYVTAKDTGQRLAKAGDVELADSPPINEKETYIFVDPSKKFQTVMGIGGDLIDASA
jgi:glucosylceramidase